MLKINSIKPLFNKIVTTCDVYEKGKTNGGIIVKTEGTIKEYQRVEAVGSTVRDIKVGDLILINPKRYLVPQHKDKKDSIRNVIGDELTMGVNFPMVEYGGKRHLLIYDQDIDYIIDGEEVEEEQKTSSLILPEEKKVIV
jgi:hypothetical protein